MGMIWDEMDGNGDEMDGEGCGMIEDPSSFPPSPPPHPPPPPPLLLLLLLLCCPDLGAGATAGVGSCGRGLALLAAPTAPGVSR
jgi:hypothetical protein